MNAQEYLKKLLIQSPEFREHTRNKMWGYLQGLKDMKTLMIEQYDRSIEFYEGKLKELTDEE